MVCYDKVPCRFWEQCPHTVRAHITFEFPQQLTFVHIFKLKRQDYSLEDDSGRRVSNTKTSKAQMSTNFRHILSTSMGWIQTRKSQNGQASSRIGFFWNKEQSEWRFLKRKGAMN